jgi:hypothetical protein
MGKRTRGKPLVELEKLYERCNTASSKMAKMYCKSHDPKRRRLARLLSKATQLGHRVLDIMEEVREELVQQKKPSA